MRKYSKKSASNVNEAKQHIEELFEQANKSFSTNPELSNRYVDLARKTAMKFKISLTSEQKRQFCKHCYNYLRPGVNARVRNQSGKMVYTCFSCKKYNRIPIK